MASSAQIAVSQTPVQLAQGKKQVLVEFAFTTGGGSVYLGGTDTVDASSGFILTSAGPFVLDLGTADELWCVVLPGGSALVQVLRVGGL